MKNYGFYPRSNMDSKLIHPNFYAVHDAWIQEYKGLSGFNPENWQKFLKECGLEHISMSRLKVSNKKMYMLAKIKYGF